MSELEGLCDSCGPGFVRDAVARRDNAPGYADRIKSHIDGCTGGLSRYYKHLGRRFGQPPALKPFHADLVQLPFVGALTTNYDSVIEAALSGIAAEREGIDKTIVPGRDPRYREQDFRESLIQRGRPRMVAHIHGYHADPSHIVLGASDYARAYGTDVREEKDGNRKITFRPATDFLRPILQTWSLVFIGFRLQDPDFNALLQDISNDYESWGDDKHFVLLGSEGKDPQGETEREEVLLERYGIQVIWYHQLGTDHSALYDFVARIRERLSPRQERSNLLEPTLQELNRRFREETRE